MAFDVNAIDLTSPANFILTDDTESWIQATLSAEDATDYWTVLTPDSPTATQDISSTDYTGGLTILITMNHRTVTEHILILFIVIIGLIGNALLIIVLIKNSALRKQASNVLILNQSIIDLLAALSLGITCIIGVLYDYGLINVPLNESSFFSRIWCTCFLNHDITRPFFYAWTLSLICITVERYIGTCHPFTHIKWGKNRIVKTSFAFIYVLGPAIPLYLMHSTTWVEDGQCVWKLTIIRVNVDSLVFLLSHYVISIAVLVTLYSLILKELASKLKASSHSDNHVSTEKAICMAKVNTIKTLLMVTALYMLCWTGLITVYILVATDIFYSDILYGASELIIFASCCCNPFIYIFRSNNYREKIIQLFSSF